MYHLVSPINRKSGPKGSARNSKLLLAFALRGFPFFHYGLRRSQPRDWHAERRSADIIHADLMAELNAFRVAAVLAADADLQIWTRFAALFDAHANHHSNTLNVEGLEGIAGEDAGLLLVH